MFNKNKIELPHSTSAEPTRSLPEGIFVAGDAPRHPNTDPVTGEYVQYPGSADVAGRVATIGNVELGSHDNFVGNQSSEVAERSMQPFAPGDLPLHPNTDPSTGEYHQQ
jgi:hypothetical protein